MSQLLSRLGSLESRLMFMCLALVVVGAWMLVQIPGQSVAMAEKRQDEVDFREFAELYAEIFRNVRENYVDEVGSKELFEAAIQGMFFALDDHSSWLPPAQQKLLHDDTEGEYSGVGLHIMLDSQRRLTVIMPIVGGPSFRAGIEPWDRIIQIDGETTKNITLLEAVQRLKGPEGTEVSVKVLRPGQTERLDFIIRRETIKVDSVFHKMLKDDVGYLRISKFQEDTSEMVRDALLDFNDKGAQGVIVDLRRNAGGLLVRANEVCDMFLDEGKTIVTIKGRHARDNREYYSLERPLCSQPLVVLVDQMSASASEIFAGAMQDNHRGLIIGPKGTTTFGKGSVQTISELEHSLDRDENGDYRPSGLRLTTARYYTPSGRSIHRNEEGEGGITPDIGVEISAEQQTEIYRRGLLGEPTVVEPEHGDNGTTGTTTGPESGGDALDDISPEMMEEIAIEQNRSDRDGPFRDLLLEEAAKYLRAIMLVDQRRAA